MNSIWRLFVSLCMLACIAGCVTGEKVRADLEVGMSRSQVIDLLGKPDGVRNSDNSEVLQYTNRLISGWSYDRADYFVILRESAVVEYGTGEVRQAPVAQGGFFFFVH